MLDNGRTTSNSVSVYVNGVSLIVSGGTSSNLNLDDMDWFYIGVDNYFNSQEMKGDIRPLYKYIIGHDPLSSEVLQNYNVKTHKGRFT